MTTPAAAATSTNATLQNYLDQQQAKINATNAASASSSSSATGVFKNESTFLNILTTQLQHQDPTATTDTNQFTQELVQFAQVEQQLNTNKDLETLVSIDKGNSGVRGALGYVGQYVAVSTTDQMSLQSGKAEIAYDLSAADQTVKVNISDASGKTVRTLDGSTNQGTNYLTWDGKDSSGTQLSDGAYTFNIAATTKTGGADTVSNTQLIGQVTGVTSNTDGTTNLSVGSVSIATSKVQSAFTANTVPVATTTAATTTNTTTNTTSG